MTEIVRRNRLLPWNIGLVIILAAVSYVGYQMFYVGCPAPLGVELIVLAVVPLVYLALMYLTFVSQK
ncbi:MAG: hypothetical protein K9G60_16835 [Pseudolabrys sp.]|nr:hypothetical protein [Pseudolabrys sp.]